MKNREEFYSSDKIGNRYAEFLKDKRVVLVGPAKSMEGSGQGKIIDSYDIVVRVNLGLRVPKSLRKDIGSRLDVLYCGMSKYYFDTKVFSKKSLLTLKKKYDIKWLVNTGVRRKTVLKIAKYNQKSKTNINIKLVTKRNIGYLYKRLKSKPTAGTVAFYDLLQYGISELYVTGFTFYNILSPKAKRKNYYYNDYSPRYSKSIKNVYKHNVKAEARFFCKLYEKDKRIKVDGALSDIMEKLK